MARFRRRAGRGAAASSHEHQTTLFERLDSLARRAEVQDPSGPATAVFCCVLALMALGLLLQASHAATITDRSAYAQEVMQQAGFRLAGIGVLLGAQRLGPQGLRRQLPALVVLSGVLLFMVWVPGVAKPENGSHRWVRLPLVGTSFQPSELARIVLVVWVADRCSRLGERLLDMRRGVLPILTTGLFFVAMIGVETDLGGALLFLACFMSTLWVGGARLSHAAGSVATIGGVALVAALSSLEYIRGRIAVFLGHAENAQVTSSIEALGSGGLFGVGLGQGLFRNAGVPYQDSDYVFALVGEELGLFGAALVLGLLIAFAWASLRLVLSIRDRYRALAAFGLLLSVGLQSMIHLQVVTGLAPPKGMTLPFVSDGGTSLVVSSLAIGLALGAARPARDEAPGDLPAIATATARAARSA